MFAQSEACPKRTVTHILLRASLALLLAATCLALNLVEPRGAGAQAVPGTVKWDSGVIAGNNFDSPASLGPNGRIYVQKQDGKLYSFTPEGALKWNREIGGGLCGMVTAPAIGADGTIYAASCDGFLYALTDQDTDSSVLWRYPGPGIDGLASINSSPAIGADGTIYFGCADGKLYAVSAPGFGDAGMLKWSYQAANYVNVSPAIGADGTIYLAAAYGYFYALKDDGDHATLSWRYPAVDTPIEAIGSSPALGNNGTIYFGAGNLNDANLYALRPNGTLKWKFTAMQGGIDAASPVIGADGTIYIGTMADGATDGRLYAITDNGTSAAKKWDYQIRPEGPDIYGMMDTPAIDNNGVIYFGASDGWVYALTDEGSSAGMQWRCPLTKVYGDETFEPGNIPASPLLGPDGTIYIGSAGLDVFYAIYGDSEGTALNSSWPTFHRDAARTGQSIAELAITSIDSPPPLKKPGTKLTITNFVRNDAGEDVQIGAANAPTATFYSLVRIGHPPVIFGTGTLPVVPAWTTVKQTKTFTLPSDIPRGTYQLHACADFYHTINEIYDANNCAAAAGTIMVAVIPDLTEKITAFVPAKVARGAAVSVTDTLTNRGTGKSGASSTVYYLSKYPLSGGTAHLLGKRFAPPLLPGQTSSGTVSLTIPKATAVGNYYIRACADGPNKVAEAFEDNNCASRALTVEAAAEVSAAGGE